MAPAFPDCEQCVVHGLKIFQPVCRIVAIFKNVLTQFFIPLCHGSTTVCREYQLERWWLCDVQLAPLLAWGLLKEARFHSLDWMESVSLARLERGVQGLKVQEMHKHLLGEMFPARVAVEVGPETAKWDTQIPKTGKTIECTCRTSVEQRSCESCFQQLLDWVQKLFANKLIV